MTILSIMSAIVYSKKLNFKEIASCLERLVSDTDLRKKMGYQSKKLLQSEYSINKLRQKYINLIIHQ